MNDGPVTLGDLARHCKQFRVVCPDCGHSCFHARSVGWINSARCELLLHFFDSGLNHAKLVTDPPLLNEQGSDFHGECLLR
jgi:hypothetical protein